MKKLTIIAIMLTCITCYSQPKVNVKNNPKYFTEGIYLKEGGEIAKDHIQCRLIEVRKTMRGYKHSFVSDTSGILVRYYNTPLQINLCYQITIKK